MDWRRQYMTRYYLGRPGWRDGTTEFHALCEAHVPEGAPILEAGRRSEQPHVTFFWRRWATSWASIPTGRCWATTR